MRMTRISTAVVIAAFTVSIAVGCAEDTPTVNGAAPDTSGTGGASANAGGIAGKSGGGGSAGKGSGARTANDGGSAGNGAASADASTGGTGDGGANGSGGAGPSGSGGGGGDASVGTGGAPAGPVCGNNTVESGEECDDGNTRDGDGCSSVCTKKCETCEATAPGCKDLQTACYELDGVATEGPAQGVAKADLCAEVIACIRKSDCAYSPADPLSGLDDGVSGCYCGDATFAECIQQQTKAPNGPCKAEIEAAAETTTPKTVGVRGLNPSYALGGAFSLIKFCDQDPALCLSSCLRNLASTDGGRSDSGP